MTTLKEQTLALSQETMAVIEEGKKWLAPLAARWHSPKPREHLQDALYFALLVIPGKTQKLLKSLGFTLQQPLISLAGQDLYSRDWFYHWRYWGERYDWFEEYGKEWPWNEELAVSLTKILTLAREEAGENTPVEPHHFLFAIVRQHEETGHVFLVRRNADSAGDRVSYRTLKAVTTPQGEFSLELAMQARETARLREFARGRMRDELARKIEELEKHVEERRAELYREEMELGDLAREIGYIP